MSQGLLRPAEFAQGISQIGLRAGGIRPDVEETTALLCRFLKDCSGATAIEYGLIAALIGVAIITAVQLVGTNLNSTFNSVSVALR